MSSFILSAFADEIDDDFKIQMDVLDRYGIKCIEMRSVYGKNITRFSIEEINDIKRQLDKRGFKISAIGSPIGKINITDGFKPHLDLFKHTVNIAQTIGTKYIRMFSFYIPQKEDPAIYRDEVMARWKSFVNEAKDSGLTLLHENEKDIYGDTAERCLDIIETMNDDSVKAIFDPANFVQCNEETFPKTYNLLKEHIMYMHIKDARSIDHNVVPSGAGDGCIKEILSSLIDRNYNGYLSLEPHLGSFTGLKDLELDNDISKMPEGGPKQFSIAYEALKIILTELEAQK